MTLSRTASDGFSKGADLYQRARPSYPVEALLWLGETLGLRAGKRVLEVGAGTGKFTRILLETGAEVTGLEPVEAMRRHLQHALPRVRVINGLAHQLPDLGFLCDAVVCAQAFHWFATSEVLREFRRVLSPGGGIGLIWNYRDTTVPWVAELERISASYQADVPRFSPELVRSLFPAEGYAELREQCVDYAHVGSVETVVIERTMSTSYLAALPEEQQKDVQRQVRDVIDRYPELSSRSEVSYPYKTYMFSAIKIGLD